MLQDARWTSVQWMGIHGLVPHQIRFCSNINFQLWLRWRWILNAHYSKVETSQLAVGEGSSIPGRKQAENLADVSARTLWSSSRSGFCCVELLIGARGNGNQCKSTELHLQLSWSTTNAHCMQWDHSVFGSSHVGTRTNEAMRPVFRHTTVGVRLPSIKHCITPTTQTENVHGVAAIATLHHQIITQSKSPGKQ